MDYDQEMVDVWCVCVQMKNYKHLHKVGIGKGLWL